FSTKEEKKRLRVPTGAGRPNEAKGKRGTISCPYKETEVRRLLLALGDGPGGSCGVADGVAVDDELDTAVALAACGGFVGSDGLERVAAGVKEHVRHVDDEAASGVARLQDGIELIEELGAKLSFFGFGLRGGLARLLSFSFGGALLRLRGGAIPGGLVCGSL